MTPAQIDSACMSFNHSFGLMTEEAQNQLRYQAKEWLIAFGKEARPAMQMVSGTISEEMKAHLTEQAVAQNSPRPEIDIMNLPAGFYLMQGGERRVLVTIQPDGEDLKAAKDQAYEERNHLVALLAAIFPSGRKATDIPGWNPEWHNAVYIQFPWGQASWHYHDSQAHLFAHLPDFEGEWDGHTTEAKYEAIRKASTDLAALKNVRGL